MIYEWSEQFEIGDDTIDSQHRQLVETYNRLYISCTSGDAAQEAKEIEKVLGFLLNYTAKHFSDEEALQLQCNYPDRERHKKIHDTYTAKVITFIEQFSKEGFTAGLAVSLNAEIGAWLIKHIKLEDIKMAKHIQK